MIRKAAMLFLMASVMIFSAWKFYINAIAYDPLDEEAVKHAKIKESVVTKSVYARSWGAEIHEKNLFSPTRTYMEPKPIPVAPPPVELPKRPEIALRGIVLDTFGDYVAYVEINQAKAMPLRKGDKVEGLEVSDVTEKKVVLKWYTEMITMSIEKVKTLSNRPRMGK